MLDRAKNIFFKLDIVQVTVKIPWNNIDEQLEFYIRN